MEEANERAAVMENRAEESEKDAREAKRHSVWANIIAVVALAITDLPHSTLGCKTPMGLVAGS